MISPASSFGVSKMRLKSSLQKYFINGRHNLALREKLINLALRKLYSEYQIEKKRDEKINELEESNGLYQRFRIFG
jgi:hypothetical protein